MLSVVEEGSADWLWEVQNEGVHTGTTGSSGACGGGRSSLERKSHGMRGQSGAERPSLWISAAQTKGKPELGSGGDLCSRGCAAPFFIHMQLRLQ